MQWLCWLSCLIADHLHWTLPIFDQLRPQAFLSEPLSAAVGGRRRKDLDGSYFSHSKYSSIFSHHLLCPIGLLMWGPLGQQSLLQRFNKAPGWQSCTACWGPPGILKLKSTWKQRQFFKGLSTQPPPKWPVRASSQPDILTVLFK